MSDQRHLWQAARSETARERRYALLPGDPGRVHRLAERLDRADAPTVDGPLVSVSGELEGEAVTVAATGMGAPSTIATVTRLLDDGHDTFLRVGGAGPVVDSIRVNDIICGTAAVRHEGASHRLLPGEWPAVADLDVVTAVRAAMEAAGRRPISGVLHTKDSFFGELDPGSSPVESELLAHWDAMQRLRVVASEMEASALFVLASVRGARAGAVVKINDPDGALGGGWTGDEDLCDVAVDALRRLIRSDRRAP